MVICVIDKCKIEYGPKDVSFYGFPFKRPEILEQWIHAVQMQNRKSTWTIKKSTKICSNHFLPSDFREKPAPDYKLNLLKPNAIPSVFGSKHSHNKSTSPQREMIAENLCTNAPLDIPMPMDFQIKVEESEIAFDPPVGDDIKTIDHSIKCGIKIDRSIQCNTTKTAHRAIQCAIIKRVDRSIQCGIIERERVDHHVQCEIMETKHYRRLVLKNRILTREIKTLKQKLRRRDLKMSNVIDVIQEINNTCFDNDSMDYFEDDEDGPPAAVPSLLKSNKWVGEDEEEDVKESWEDDDDEKKEEEESKPTTEAKKHKKKLAQIIAEKEAKKKEELEQRLREQQEEEISPEEKIRMEKESDLKLALETTFGQKLEEDTEIGGLKLPSNTEEFEEFTESLSKKLTPLSRHGNDYVTFAEGLTRNLCAIMNSTDIKRIRNSLDNLFLEKQKMEKGDKGKKNKGKGKAKLKLEGENAQLSAYVNEFDYDEFDDFM